MYFFVHALIKSQPLRGNAAGIVIHGDESNERLMSALTVAIESLKETSPVVFSRLSTNVKAIGFVKAGYRAAYLPILDVCLISEPKIPKEEIIPYLAGALVYETTHGHLFSKRVPLTAKTAERVRDICQSAQWRAYGKVLSLGGKEIKA